jgi:hypothetical protein
MNKQKEETASAISSFSKGLFDLSLLGPQKIDPGQTRANPHNEEESGTKPTGEIAVVLQRQKAQVREPEIENAKRQQEATKQYFQRHFTTPLHGM